MKLKNTRVSHLLRAAAISLACLISSSSPPTVASILTLPLNLCPRKREINTRRKMPTGRNQSRNNFETGWIASSTGRKERLCDRQHSNSSPEASALVSPRTSTCGERGGEIATKSFHLRRESPAAEAVQTH